MRFRAAGVAERGPLEADPEYRRLMAMPGVMLVMCMSRALCGLP